MAKKAVVKKEDNPYSVAGLLPIRDDDYLPVEELRYGSGIFSTNRALVTKRHGNRRRPSITDPGVLDRICAELSVGKGLWEITRSEDFPSRKEIYLAMARDATGEVATRITQAREAGQEAVMDLIRDLNDNITELNYNSTMVKIKNLQWQMAKLAPKKYGRDAEDAAQLIDNRRQYVINVTSADYAKVVDRLTQDV